MRSECRRGLSRQLAPGILVLVFSTVLSAWGSVTPAAAQLPTPTNCQSDVQGANDQPGQKDVTEFCVDTGDNSPFELHTSISLDLVTLPGGNTADICTLYDTDSDGNVNLAVCVTLIDGGNPASLGEVRLFTCGDTRVDRCTSSVQVNTCTGGSSCLVDADCPGGETCAMQFDTACEADQQATDPFLTGSDFPLDTVAVCAVDLDDFGAPGAGARIIDACSYPSTIPNSDPSDCILFQGCTTALQCDDANPCTIDACDPSGVCTHTPDTGASCDDGDVCTVNTTCTSLGFCGGGSPLDCNDDDACTTDSCTPLVGCTHVPVLNGSACDDGAFCTINDACVAGACIGTLRDCSDGIACTVDACNEVTDQCGHTPNDAVCNNGQFCDGTETCNPLTGCAAGTPVNCADSIPCTVDACNESTDTCDHTPNDAVCNNGQFCDGMEICNALLGCLPGTPVICADSIVCTVDVCNETIDACDHTPTNALCDNGLFCDGFESCNPLTGCVADTPVNCGDSIACTTDLCNELTDECDHVANNGACNNGQFCDGIETCDANLGCVAGTPVNCSDSVACTVDACNEATDLCQSTPSHAACSNGLFCDGSETCDPLLGCLSALPVNCDDLDTCTLDTCNESLNQCQNVDQCCGNGVIDPGEDCEPPNEEDCNNGVDDDGDGRADCRDFDSCADENFNGVETCGLDCTLDTGCTRIRRDPAFLNFGKKGKPDRLRIHGRFKLSSPVNPFAEGFAFSLVNDHAEIYRGSLVPGDLKIAGPRFFFKDATAKFTGAGIRDGISSVRLKVIEFEGAPYLSFVVIVYGDMSEAKEPWMTTQIVVGNDAAYLRAPWILLKNGWKLLDSIFGAP